MDELQELDIRLAQRMGYQTRSSKIQLNDGHWSDRWALVSPDGTPVADATHYDEAACWGDSPRFSTTWAMAGALMEWLGRQGYRCEIRHAEHRPNALVQRWDAIITPIGPGLHAGIYGRRTGPLALAMAADLVLAEARR